MTRLAPSRVLLALFALLLATPAFAQTSPVGTWRTVDDETGEPKSIVRVFEENGVLVGEIQQLLPEGRRCTDCASRFNNSDLRGTRILTGFRQSGNEYTGGRITDPKSGRVYRAKMRVERDGRLRVWGYVGVDSPLTRRAQYWERVR